MAEREGFLLPRRSRSSAEAGHPHCHSLRSLFFPWKHSGWLRIPTVLCASSCDSRDTNNEIRVCGGEGGIRTLGKALDPPHDFQSCTFDRSVTSPIAGVVLYQKLVKEQPKLRSSCMFSVKCFAKNQSNLHIIRILCKLQNQ